MLLPGVFLAGVISLSTLPSPHSINLRRAALMEWFSTHAKKRRADGINALYAIISFSIDFAWTPPPKRMLLFYLRAVSQPHPTGRHFGYQLV